MFNQTVIIGRLGTQPALKSTKSNTSMCSFAVAVNVGWGDNKATDWYNVTVFGKTADACAKSLSKGSLVCVAGSLHLHQYEGKDGSKKTSLELTADRVQFLSSTKEKNQPEPQPAPSQVTEDPFVSDDMPF